MTQPLRASTTTTVYNVDRSLSDGKEGLHFVNPETESILRGGNSSNKKETAIPIKQSLLLQDIAQSHHFTIHISGLSSSKFKTPEGTFSEFLPVKSMNFNYLSYENMTIPVAIFGDFPLLNKKRLTTVSLTCFDLDNNLLERELKTWEDRCFPMGRFAAYMDDIVKELTYRGYDVKGRETLKYKFFVIPSGNVGVSRDYSANDAKLVTFNLICVGDGSTCATGENKSYKILKQSTNNKVTPIDGKDIRLSGDDQMNKTNYDADLINREQGKEFIPTDIV